MSIVNKISLIILSFLISFAISAQEAEFKGVKTFEDAGEFKNVGFYTLFQAKGERGRMRNYTLKFLDFDYNEISQQNIELTKRANIDASKTNKTHLAVAITDSWLDQVSIRTYDKTGVLVGKLEFKEKKDTHVDLYESENGFILVKQVSMGSFVPKYQFEIISVDNELNINWKKVFTKEENVSEIVDVLSKNGSTAVVFSQVTGEKRNRTFSQNLMRISSEGEKVFKTAFAENYYYFPSKIFIKGETTYVFGSFPKKGKPKPAGVFAIGFSENGEIINKNEINFEKSISKKLEELDHDKDLNIEEDPQFLINDVIQTKNGFYLITETVQLKTHVRTTFIMGDFLILKLNKDLTLKNLKVVTKDKNKIIFEGTFSSINLYYRIMRHKAWDLSNYQFQVKNQEGNPAMVYTIKEWKISNVEVGVVDITTEDHVKESDSLVSDLEEIEHMDYPTEIRKKNIGYRYKVLRNKPGNLSVIIHEGQSIKFYDLSY